MGGEGEGQRALETGIGDADEEYAPAMGPPWCAVDRGGRVGDGTLLREKGERDGDEEKKRRGEKKRGREEDTERERRGEIEYILDPP